jgi:hypothetical protein
MTTLSMWDFCAILLAVVLAVTPLSVASQAEDPEGAVVVNVPFDFENGSQHFTAGLYTIRMGYPTLLIIQGESGFGFAWTWFDKDDQPSKTTKVVFRRYDNQYFLDQVWVAGETSHTYCLPSKAENLKIAADRIAPTSVAVEALETHS